MTERSEGVLHDGGIVGGAGQGQRLTSRLGLRVQADGRPPDPAPLVQRCATAGFVGGRAEQIQRGRRLHFGRLRLRDVLAQEGCEAHPGARVPACIPGTQSGQFPQRRQAVHMVSHSLCLPRKLVEDGAALLVVTGSDEVQGAMEVGDGLSVGLGLLGGAGCLADHRKRRLVPGYCSAQQVRRPDSQRLGRIVADMAMGSAAALRPECTVGGFPHERVRELEAPLPPYPDPGWLRTAALSDGLDPQQGARRLSNALDMSGVRGYNAISPANRPLHDGDINDIVVGGATSQHPDVTGDPLAQRLRQAHRQQTGQACLPRPAAPGLGQHRSGHDRGYLFGKEGSVQRPHTAVVALCSHEGPSVVGNSRYHADLRDDRLGAGLPRSALARAKPSASSSGVRAPCSRSHSAMPRPPASKRRRRVAVSASQALKVVPPSAAAWSIASASWGGRETDRLARCAIGQE